MFRARRLLSSLSSLNRMSEPRFANGDAAAEAFKQHIRGKTVMITGGSLGGIGAEAAQIIARHDPKLLIVSFRTQEKADALFKQIRETSKAPLKSILLDTSSMRNIREVSKTIDGPIDVLIHNAGTAQDTLKRTEEGLELSVATNHVGPFLLTKELLPKMSSPPRIVMVSSGAHTMYPFRFDDWNWKQGDYDGMHAYGASKVGGVLFCSALARKSKGKVEAISITPGAIYTNLVASNSEERKREMGILNEDGSVKKEWFISTNEGCRALITAAFDPELPKEKNGAYLNSRAWIAPEDQKPPNGIAAHAIGEDLEDKLWSLSEEIIGETFELK